MRVLAFRKRLNKLVGEGSYVEPDINLHKNLTVISKKRFRVLR